MTLLDSCLSIIEPGYHAPDADRPVFEPRIRPAHRLCACGADEVRIGRTQCEDCIAKTAAGMAEIIKHRQAERATKTARRAREREARQAAGKSCACGRPAPCNRRMCR